MNVENANTASRRSFLPGIQPTATDAAGCAAKIREKTAAGIFLMSNIRRKRKNRHTDAICRRILFKCVKNHPPARLLSSVSHIKDTFSIGLYNPMGFVINASVRNNAGMFLNCDRKDAASISR